MHARLWQLDLSVRDLVHGPSMHGQTTTQSTGPKQRFYGEPNRTMELVMKEALSICTTPAECCMPTLRECDSRKAPWSRSLIDQLHLHLRFFSE